MAEKDENTNHGICVCVLQMYFVFCTNGMYLVYLHL